MTVEIFNRWGEKLNDSRITTQIGVDELYVWDGYTTVGKEVNEGTYYYVITYITRDEKVESLKGSLTVLK